MSIPTGGSPTAPQTRSRSEVCYRRVTEYTRDCTCYRICSIWCSLGFPDFLKKPLSPILDPCVDFISNHVNAPIEKLKANVCAWGLTYGTEDVSKAVGDKAIEGVVKAISLEVNAAISDFTTTKIPKPVPKIVTKLKNHFSEDFEKRAIAELKESLIPFYAKIGDLVQAGTSEGIYRTAGTLSVFNQRCAMNCGVSSINGLLFIAILAQAGSLFSDHYGEEDVTNNLSFLTKVTGGAAVASLVAVAAISHRQGNEYAEKLKSVVTRLLERIDEQNIPENLRKILTAYITSSSTTSEKVVVEATVQSALYDSLAKTLKSISGEYSLTPVLERIATAGMDSASNEWEAQKGRIPAMKLASTCETCVQRFFRKSTTTSSNLPKPLAVTAPYEVSASTLAAAPETPILEAVKKPAAAHRIIDFIAELIIGVITREVVHGLEASSQMDSIERLDAFLKDGTLPDKLVKDGILALTDKLNKALPLSAKSYLEGFSGVLGLATLLTEVYATFPELSGDHDDEAQELEELTLAIRDHATTLKMTLDDFFYLDVNESIKTILHHGSALSEKSPRVAELLKVIIQDHANDLDALINRKKEMLTTLLNEAKSASAEYVSAIYEEIEQARSELAELAAIATKNCADTATAIPDSTSKALRELRSQIKLVSDSLKLQIRRHLSSSTTEESLLQQIKDVYAGLMPPPKKQIEPVPSELPQLVKMVQPRELPKTVKPETDEEVVKGLLDAAAEHSRLQTQTAASKSASSFAVAASSRPAQAVKTTQSAEEAESITQQKETTSSWLYFLQARGALLSPFGVQQPQELVPPAPVPSAAEEIKTILSKETAAFIKRTDLLIGYFEELRAKLRLGMPTYMTTKPSIPMVRQWQGKAPDKVLAMRVSQYDKITDYCKLLSADRRALSAELTKMLGDTAAKEFNENYETTDRVIIQLGICEGKDLIQYTHNNIDFLLKKFEDSKKPKGFLAGFGW